jgi:hypothetical protein
VGLSLLTIGLLAYSVIPNVHTVSVQSSIPLAGPSREIVNPNSGFETPQNISIMAGRNNTLLVNLTVTTGSGNSSSVQFKLFTAPDLGSCMREEDPTGCIVNQNVSNQTISVPLNASSTSTYFFGFANYGSGMSKTVVLSSSLLATSVSRVAARDGVLNYAGLALGALGLVVALYGVVAKTVIPWE